MPKRSKSGPPYTDVPDEVYVVVTNPWGMHTNNPRERGQLDFNRVAAWARFALQHSEPGARHAPTVECIYSMGTRNEIILQFPEDTNIIPLLGEHRWKDFSRRYQDPNQSTCVFRYNWTNNGDPANHNWTESFPDPIPLNEVPAHSPYPKPSWISPPSTLTSFVQPIPRPRTLPQIPDNGRSIGQDQKLPAPPPLLRLITSPALPPKVDHPKSGEQPVEGELGSINLFKPYEPPSQHPSHAQFLNQSESRNGEAPSSQARPQSPTFIKKLDPYELEEDALNILRAPNFKGEDPEEADVKPALHLSIKVEIPEVRVKVEDNGRNNLSARPDSRYQPSQGLVDAFSSLRRAENSTSSTYPPVHERRRCSTVAQAQAPASLGYQPTAELEAEINALLQGKSSTVSSLPSSSNTRPMPIAGTHIAIKREYEDGVTTSLRERKKIKIEED